MAEIFLFPYFLGRRLISFFYIIKCFLQLYKKSLVACLLVAYKLFEMSPEVVCLALIVLCYAIQAFSRRLFGF